MKRQIEQFSRNEGKRYAQASMAGIYALSGKKILVIIESKEKRAEFLKLVEEIHGCVPEGLKVEATGG